MKPCQMCGAPGRQYINGWRCPLHTPAALAGRPEPPELEGPPWWVRDGHVIPPPPISASWLVTTRAIASGRKRVRDPSRYREAKAADDARKARESAIRRGAGWSPL